VDEAEGEVAVELRRRRGQRHESLVASHRAGGAQQLGLADARAALDQHHTAVSARGGLHRHAQAV
jgi:hypothetical protein